MTTNQTVKLANAKAKIIELTIALGLTESEYRFVLADLLRGAMEDSMIVKPVNDKCPQCGTLPCHCDVAELN